uniref:Serine protease 27-like n=1 Tax=Xenopus tropicalis TaxID=8364 RepID=A0A803JKY6_XENTR
MDWFHLIRALLLLNLGIYGFAKEEAKLSKVCGKPVVDRSRIVGGQDSKKGQHPWQAIVWHPSKVRCGGTLISSRYVLTAAQCLESENDTSVIVILGAYNITGNHKEEVSVKVNRIILHHRYNDSDFPYDIALLELSNSVPFTDFILPACLPPFPTEFLPGHSCLVTGWGDTDYDSTKPKPVILQEAGVRLIDLQHCRDLYKLVTNDSIITENMTCAMDIHGKRSFCRGDGGGPLVCHAGEQWFLVGVVSFGYGCGHGIPGVYTSVPAYVDWIKEHISSGGSGWIGSRPGVALNVRSLSAFIFSLCSLFWVSLQNPMFILMLSTVIWVGC